MGQVHVKEVLQGFLARLYAQRQTLVSELQLLDQQIIEIITALNEIGDIPPTDRCENPPELPTR